MSRRPWTPDDLAALRRLWAAGLPTKVIARRLGRSKGSVEGKRLALRLPLRRPFRWTPAALAQLRLLWATPLVIAEMARQLGCRADTLRKKARRLGLPSRAPGRPRRRAV